MSETLRIARLGVRALLKDKENALAGRVQDTGMGGPTVPEEVSAMDRDKPLSKVLYDAVRLLEAGLITDKGTMSDNDTLEISRTLSFFRQRITKGDVPISVKAIVKDPKGRILVMRDAYTDYWDLPGGHVQEGETLMHAMTRELLEETGLGAGQVRQTDTRMLDFAGEVKPVCMYEVEFIGGTPRISTEHLGFQWADPRELPKLNLGVYKDILLPQRDSNENLEELLEDDTIVEKEGDGGGISGAGDTTIGTDVHDNAIGSPKRSVFKALAEPELMDEFIQNFHKNVLVTGDSPMPEGEEIELRGNKVVKGLRSNYFEDTDLHVIYKAEGSPFIVAGYASPVVIDQEGHRVSHHALAEDLPRFMANNGEYSNLNVIHSNLTVGKIIPEFTSQMGKTYRTEVDDIGLFVVAEVRTDPYRPEVVNQVIEDIEAGKLKSFSISGNAENPVFTCDKQRCFYNIDKVNLFEITLCTVPNTNILTKNGYKEIKDIKMYELVYTATHNWKPVTKIMNREVEEELVILRTEEGEVKLTSNHPVHKGTYNNLDKYMMYDWIRSDEIKVGDLVHTFKGDKEILSIDKEYYEGIVYNLEVADDNSYTTQICVVHNCEEGVNQDAKFEVISHP